MRLTIDKLRGVGQMDAAKLGAGAAVVAVVISAYGFFFEVPKELGKVKVEMATVSGQLAVTNKDREHLKANLDKIQALLAENTKAVVANSMQLKVANTEFVHLKKSIEQVSAELEKVDTNLKNELISVKEYVNQIATNSAETRMLPIYMTGDVKSMFDAIAATKAGHTLASDAFTLECEGTPVRCRIRAEPAVLKKLQTIPPKGQE